MTRILESINAAGMFKLLYLWLFIGVSPVLADVAVIVHPDSSAANITVREAVDIFLGKTHQLRDGTRLIPLDQRARQPAREEFYRRAANKSAAQLKAYWARQVFTGQGEPPLSMRDDTEVKMLVANNPNMIGYIDAERVDQSVKLVLLIH